MGMVVSAAVSGVPIIEQLEREFPVKDRPMTPQEHNKVITSKSKPTKVEKGHRKGQTEKVRKKTTEGKISVRYDKSTKKPATIRKEQKTKVSWKQEKSAPLGKETIKVSRKPDKSATLSKEPLKRKQEQKAISKPKSSKAHKSTQ